MSNMKVYVDDHWFCVGAEVWFTITVWNRDHYEFEDVCGIIIIINEEYASVFLTEAQIYYYNHKTELRPAGKIFTAIPC